MGSILASLVEMATRIGIAAPQPLFGSRKRSAESLPWSGGADVIGMPHRMQER